MQVWKSELRRAFLRPAFWLAAVGICVVALMGGAQELKQAFSGMLPDGMGEAWLLTGYAALCSDPLVMAIPILCTLPYAAMFVEEFQSRFLVAYLPRTGCRAYLGAKTGATLLAGGGAVLCGCLIACAVFLMLLPPTGARQELYAIPLQAILERVVLLSLGGCLWSLAGGAFAAAAANKYMAYACPFILFYVMSAFRQRYYSGAALLDPWEWMKPNLSTTPFFAALIVSVAACALMGIAYAALMKRRIANV